MFYIIYNGYIFTAVSSEKIEIVEEISLLPMAPTMFSLQPQQYLPRSCIQIIINKHTWTQHQ